MRKSNNNFSGLFILGSLFLFSCSGVEKYYDSVKDALHAKTNNIQDILKKAEDHEETDLAPGKGLNELPQAAKDVITNPEAAKAKLYPLKNEDCFILDIESIKGKPALSYFETGPILHTELLSDDIYLVSQKDSIGNQRDPEYFKKHVENYLKRKYLVLVDCQYYYYPQQLTMSEFNGGHLIKKVSVYDIDTKKLADSYYLYATSSSKIRYNTSHPVNFAENLAANITGQLTGSLFSSY